MMGTIVAAQLIGGALAGMGGTCEILGNYDRFKWTASTQHGFDGLMWRFWPEEIPFWCRWLPCFCPTSVSEPTW